MLRSAILAAARSDRVERVVTHAPVSRQVVARFVGGSDTPDAVRNGRRLVDAGLTVTFDHLGEDTLDRSQADQVVHEYRDLLQALAGAGLTSRRLTSAPTVDVSVKLTAVGQKLPQDGEKIALENTRAICAAAETVGATVTLDMEDHTTTDSTLGLLGALRADFPTTAAVLQAYLHRTEGDCRDLAVAGSRVRLCKGAYREPASVAYQRREEVDASYARCIEILMAGPGYPMLATHDPRLIRRGTETADRYGKRPGTDYELQMLFGIRPDEQRRRAAAGHTVRVYVPYGAQWYGYLMRRLAERPANLTFFARALLTKG